MWWWWGYGLCTVILRKSYGSHKSVTNSLSILLGFHGAEYSCTHISKNFDHTHRRKRTDSPSFDQTNHRLVKACFGCLVRPHSISTQLLDLNCSTMWTFVLHLAFKWWSGGCKCSCVCFCLCLSVPLFLSDSAKIFYKHFIYISINYTRNKLFFWGSNPLQCIV